MDGNLAFRCRDALVSRFAYSDGRRRESDEDWIRIKQRTMGMWKNLAAVSIHARTGIDGGQVIRTSTCPLAVVACPTQQELLLMSDLFPALRDTVWEGIEPGANEWEHLAGCNYQTFHEKTASPVVISTHNIYSGLSPSWRLPGAIDLTLKHPTEQEPGRLHLKSSHLDKYIAIRPPFSGNQINIWLRLPAPYSTYLCHLPPLPGYQPSSSVLSQIT